MRQKYVVQDDASSCALSDKVIVRHMSGRDERLHIRFFVDL